MDGATTAGAAEAAAAAAAAAVAACRFQEGRGQELDCCSSGESPARPDIANAQPIHTTPVFSPQLSHSTLFNPCVQPHSALMKAYLGWMCLGPPLGVTRCLLLVVTTGPLTGSPPAASWRRKGGSTPAQRPARARASFSRGRPAQPAPPSYLNTSHHIDCLVDMRNPHEEIF